jgi:hypothetical protein
MAKPLLVDLLDDGYSAEELSLAPDQQEPGWQALRAAFLKARTGDFSLMRSLMSHYDPAGDYRLNYQLTLLFGDAAPSTAIDRLARALDNPADPNDYEVATNYCEVLKARGRIGDIPRMLDALERFKWSEDAHIIGVFIKELIEPLPGELKNFDEFEAFEQFRSYILLRCEEIGPKLGPEQLAFRGERFSLTRLAQLALEALRRPYFSIEWRRKFEANTGIDCRPFYKNENLQPLAAAAILEDFLDSGEAEKYEPGVRYFFGHRIPDD